MSVGHEQKVVHGLSSAQAAQRLAADGPNDFPTPRPPRLIGLLAHEAREPLSALLLLAAALSVVVLHEGLEGAAMAVIVAVDAVVSVTQQRRASRAIAGLRALTAPTARARRDGASVVIPACSVVVGDLIEVAAGDRVPADAQVVECASLAVDEQVLTGESLPVDKVAGDPVLAGTLVVRGRATATVSATGGRTAFGAIAGSLGASPPPPLERELQAVARRLGILALVAGALIVPVAYQRGSGSDRLAQAVLVGVALAVAAVPEGLPAVVTSALALGAQRMAARGAIVRQLSAIESLGATSVLCTDKTGTLTTGRVAVAAAEALPDRDGALLDAVMRTNDAVDPLDVALLEHAALSGHPAPAGQLVAERPFDAATRLSAAVHEVEGVRVVSVKGAPEAVCPRCAPGPERDWLRGRAEELARGGLRVLAVADRRTDDVDAVHLRPLGLVALRDPVRPSAAAAVADLRRAGVKVVLVTGDHPQTAVAIAAEAGLDTTPLVTGADLEGLTPTDRIAVLARAAVVARVDPATKLDLVAAHRQAGDVVAMTGDGVNDAPALRQADVGVAVAGEGGTDVAREAADLVVTDGDLGVIVHAVRDGRRIYRNLVSAISYLLSGNVSEILVVAGALFALPELTTPFIPVQLLWINLVTDGLPALALGVDRPVGDPLSQPPRQARGGLLDSRRQRGLVARGMVAAGVVLGAGVIASHHGLSTEGLRAQLLLTLLLTHLALAFVARSDSVSFGPGWWRSGVVVGSVAASAGLHALVTATAGGRALLGVAWVPAWGWGLALAAATLTVLVIDVARLLGRRRRA